MYLYNQANKITIQLSFYKDCVKALSSVQDRKGPLNFSYYSHHTDYIPAKLIWSDFV